MAKKKPTKKLEKLAIKAKNNLNIKKIPLRFSRKATLIIVIFLLLAGLLYFKRQWIIAASVNGRPIWRWQLNQTLEKKYGHQILDQLISEQLIQQKAQKEGVSISQERIDQEIKQIEAELGGRDSFQEILTSQNISLEELKDEIEKQLMLEDLLLEGIEISQEEIDQYLAENKDSLLAEDEEGKVDEATEAIKLEKMNEKFQDWYQTLREEAKIISFFN
jgi:parvulin-like peptidyl-prolyl isomerase